MPLLTNYTEEASGPDSGLIHKLLSSSNDVKTKFINDLVIQVKKISFQVLILTLRPYLKVIEKT